MSITAYKLVQVRPAPDAAYEPRGCARIRLSLTDTEFYEPATRKTGKPQRLLHDAAQIVNASHARFCARPKSAEHAALVEEISDIYAPTRKYDSALSILEPCVEYRVNEAFYGRRVSFVLAPRAVFSIEFKKNQGKHTFERVDFPLVNENLRIVYHPNGALREVVEFDRVRRMESGFYRVVGKCECEADFAYPPNGSLADLMRRHGAGELNNSFFAPEMVAAQQAYKQTVRAMIDANAQETA
jgi:hypothetical protein